MRFSQMPSELYEELEAFLKPSKIDIIQIWRDYKSNKSIDKLIDLLQDITNIISNKPKVLSNELRVYVYTCLMYELENQQYPIDKQYNFARILLEKINLETHLHWLTSEKKSLIFKLGELQINNRTTMQADKSTIQVAYPDKQPWAFFKSYKKITTGVVTGIIATGFYQANKWALDVLLCPYSRHDNLNTKIAFFFVAQLVLCGLSVGYTYLSCTNTLNNYSEKEKYDILETEIMQVSSKLEWVDNKISHSFKSPSYISRIMN